MCSSAGPRSGSPGPGRGGRAPPRDGPALPNEFRCNGVVRNLDEFYEAYGVTESDALYLAPEERVRIW
ncbi:M13-type metalloendopeptidase [Oerskovia sp. M15]